MLLKNRHIDEGQPVRVIVAAVPDAVAHAYEMAARRLELGIGEFVCASTGRVLQQDVGVVRIALGVLAGRVAPRADRSPADEAGI